MLAHEPRNPLGVIVNAVAILSRGTGLRVETRQVVTMARRQAEHLTRLLDDLLGVARISSGRLPLRREPLDLRAAVEQAVEAQRHRVDARAQRLSLVLPDRPLTVVGDPARLQQAVGNPVNNASKYTPMGGPIGVTLEVEGSRAVVRVRDGGAGIPADQLEAIFEPFNQGEATLAGPTAG